MRTETLRAYRHFRLVLIAVSSLCLCASVAFFAFACVPGLKMRPIVSVRNLSKRYYVGRPRNSSPTLRESVVGAIHSPLAHLRARRNGAGDPLWVLEISARGGARRGRGIIAVTVRASQRC